VIDSCKAEFLYRNSFPFPDLNEYVGSFIKVLVESQYLTNSNQSLIKRNIYGNEFYSSDSDVVCILQHAGVLKLNEVMPEYAGIAAYFKVSKNRANYSSYFKNGLRSRKHQAFEGHSLKFETAEELYDLGNEQNLVFMASQMPKRPREGKRKQKYARKANDVVQDMSIVFNLSSEPMNKFNLGEFGDKRSHDVIVSESVKQETLYLESLSTRYELSYNPDTKFYEIKEVMEPLKHDMNFMRNNTVPLSGDSVKAVVTDLSWREIVWGDNYLYLVEDNADKQGEAKKSETKDRSFKIPYINGNYFVANNRV